LKLEFAYPTSQLPVICSQSYKYRLILSAVESFAIGIS